MGFALNYLDARILQLYDRLIHEKETKILKHEAIAFS